MVIETDTFLYLDQVDNFTRFSFTPFKFDCQYQLNMYRNLQKKSVLRKAQSGKMPFLRDQVPFLRDQNALFRLGPPALFMFRHPWLEQWGTNVQDKSRIDSESSVSYYTFLESFIILEDIYDKNIVIFKKILEISKDLQRSF